MTIYLEWLATSTVTAEEGGDTLVTNYRRLYLDGAVSESYAAGVEVTDHAIERASDISDHAKPGLRHVVLDCVVASDPTGVREELETLRTTRQILSITTGIGTWEDMIVTNVREPRSVQTGDGLHVTIEAREIRRVDSEDVEAPAPQIERGRRQRNRGRQATDEATTDDAPPTPQTSAANRAEMRSWLDRIGSLFG